MLIAVEPPASVRFSSAARALAAEARRLGLVVPGFVSPPRTPGADRALRTSGGGAVVAVRLRDRPFDLVLRDLVDGVVACNRLRGPAATRARRALAEAVGAAQVVRAA